MESGKFTAQSPDEQALKLATMHKLGTEVFGNLDEFNKWLQKFFLSAKEKSAGTILATTSGVDFVIEELTRIAYGDAM